MYLSELLGIRGCYCYALSALLGYVVQLHKITQTSKKDLSA
jgi:hypothetical protein